VGRTLGRTTLSHSTNESAALGTSHSRSSTLYLRPQYTRNSQMSEKISRLDRHLRQE
jgi:hypothetical protein